MDLKFWVIWAEGQQRKKYSILLKVPILLLRVISLYFYQRCISILVLNFIFWVEILKQYVIRKGT